MYSTEIDKAIAKRFAGGFDRAAADRVLQQELGDISTDHLLEASPTERDRIFNLGYFTWVEQQGVSFEEFTVRREQKFWRDLRDLLPAWDRMIEQFNAETGALNAL